MRVHRGFIKNGVCVCEYIYIYNLSRCVLLCKPHE